MRPPPFRNLTRGECVYDDAAILGSRLRLGPSPMVRSRAVQQITSRCDRAWRPNRRRSAAPHARYAGRTRIVPILAYTGCLPTRRIAPELRNTFVEKPLKCYLLSRVRSQESPAASSSSKFVSYAVVTAKERKSVASPAAVSA